MTLPNHIAGGIVFTGVFAGISGINILESPGLIIATVIGATIADVDLPHSFWGRVFGPVSRMINRRFGHRTITHSLLFTGGLTLITNLICNAAEIELPYPTIILISSFSHLLFDMMTVQGVPILYPYKKNPCVIPADPNMRFNSNNRRTELSIFGFFIISGLFMKPLMSDGFWTTYNRMFGTIQHLQSEFEKSDDLLLASYKYREASNEFEDHGYVIEAAGDFAILWDERDGWKYLDGSPKSTRTILEVIPEHTGKKFEIVRQNFVQVTRDSLESIISASVVYEMQLSGNRPFGAVYEANGAREESIGKNLDLRMVDYISLNEIKPEETPVSKRRKKVRYKASPRIRTLELAIKKLERKTRKETQEYEAHKSRLEAVEAALQDVVDIYQRTSLQKELRELEKKRIDSPDYKDEITELQIQIEQLKQDDQESYAERLMEAKEEVERSNGSAPGPLLLTGIVTTIDFHSAETFQEKHKSR